MAIFFYLAGIVIFLYLVSIIVHMNMIHEDIQKIKDLLDKNSDRKH